MGWVGTQNNPLHVSIVLCFYPIPHFLYYFIRLVYSIKLNKRCKNSCLKDDNLNFRKTPFEFWRKKIVFPQKYYLSSDSKFLVGEKHSLLPLKFKLCVPFNGKGDNLNSCKKRSSIIWMKCKIGLFEYICLDIFVQQIPWL